MNFISVRGQIVLVDIMALFNYMSLYSQVKLLHDICEVIWTMKRLLFFSFNLMSSNKHTVYDYDNNYRSMLTLSANADK